MARADGEVPHARWIQTSANIALGVASDHLTTWQIVVASGQLPTYAGATLLRAALEAALLTRWLVDPRVSSEERVARGIAAQLADYMERAKFEAVAKTSGSRPPGSGKSATERTSELVAARDAANLPVVKFRGPTSLAREYGASGYRDISWLYILLSAFAHAKPWALNATQLSPGVPTSVAGISRTSAAASDTLVIGGTEIVTGHVEVAIVEHETYLGLCDVG